MEMNERAIKIARSVARRVAVNNRGLIDEGDLISECYMWMVKKQRKYEEYVENEEWGKLATSLYRHAFEYARRERARITRTRVGDHQFYTPTLLRELLPDVYEYEAWISSAPPVSPEFTRSQSRPSESNNRIAMLVDVKAALLSMQQTKHRKVLDLVFLDGLDTRQLARVLDLSEKRTRDTVERALVALADRLGGTPPWYAPGRRAVSNARAQAETRGITNG